MRQTRREVGTQSLRSRESSQHHRCSSRLKIAGLPAVARRYERVSSTRICLPSFSTQCLWAINPLAVTVGQMDYTQRCSAARTARRLPHYLLCAAIAVAISACGGTGGDSGSDASTSASPSSVSSTPPTASDTLSVSPPSISGTPGTTVVVGAKYSFQPSASDTDGDALTFSVENLPSWATFDTTSGTLSGTPVSSNVGSYQSITISVADGKAISQLPPFSIEVMAAAVTTPTSAPPTITGTPATSVQAGTHYAFQPSTTDASSKTLTFSISGMPSWASFSTTTGSLSGTPSSSNVGAFSNIVISVSDGQNSVSLAPFTITVTAIPTTPPTNTPPNITGTPPTSAQAGTAYSFQPAASDSDGDTLTFSVTNKPSWATFSTTTGQLSGTPGSGDVGTDAGIVISVSDGTTSASLPAFTITVAAAPTPPQTLGTATVTWAAPTQNTNGTSVTNLSGYVISYGTSPTALTETVTVSSAAATSYTIQNLVAGTWYFAVSAIETGGTSSAFSSVVSTTIQ